MPIMVNGGIRRLEIVNQVLAGGVAMAGIATALAVNPGLPLAWRADQGALAELPPITWEKKTMAALATMAVVGHQLRLLGDAPGRRRAFPQLKAFVLGQLRNMYLAHKYKAWMTRPAA